MKMFAKLFFLAISFQLLAQEADFGSQGQLTKGGGGGGGGGGQEKIDIPQAPPQQIIQSEQNNSQGNLMRAAASPRVVNDGAAHPIEGLILVEGGVDIRSVRKEHGVRIDLWAGDYAELHDQLMGFMNHPLSADSLSQIKGTIVNFFRTHQNKYVAVIIPVQEVNSGVIVLEILEGKVGQIKFIGQKWFNKGALTRALNVKEGDPIDETELLTYLTWVNRNPFHHLQLILAPGEVKGTTDVEFVSQERFPVRFFVGSDNTGFQANGEVRLFGGFNVGNTFMLGDLLSYQYTASPDFHSFQSHVFNYTSFLSWKNILTVFGCYGQVFPTIPNFKTEGKNIQLSGRYQVPLPPYYGDFRHHFDAGFDWKFLTSNLFFVGNVQEQAGAATNQVINITQFLFTYGLQKNWPGQVLSFNVDVYASLWKDLLPHQTNSAYESLRAGSHVRYGYMRMSLGDRYRTHNGWIISTLFRGQLAANTLPTSEQFGLGGMDTVRGYFEQQFVADNALCLNAELYTPTGSLFKAARNEFSFVFFADYGYGRNYSYSSEQFKQQHLMGVGPGLRYSIPPYFTMRADYGFQVVGIPGDHRFGRFHLSGNLSY